MRKNVKTVIAANVLLLFSVGLLVTVPTVGIVTSAALLVASYHNKHLARLWRDYYRIVERAEAKFLTPD